MVKRELLGEDERFKAAEDRSEEVHLDAGEFEVVGAFGFCKCDDFEIVDDVGLNGFDPIGWSILEFIAHFFVALSIFFFAVFFIALFSIFFRDTTRHLLVRVPDRIILLQLELILAFAIVDFGLSEICCFLRKHADLIGF